MSKSVDEHYLCILEYTYQQHLWMDVFEAATMVSLMVHLGLVPRLGCIHSEGVWALGLGGCSKGFRGEPFLLVKGILDRVKTTQRCFMVAILV